MKLAFCIVALVCFVLAAMPQLNQYPLMNVGLAFLAAALCLPL